MRIEVIAHIYQHGELEKKVDDLLAYAGSDEKDRKKILESLLSHNQKIDALMALTQAKFDEMVQRLNTVTSDIAADYQKLLDAIQSGQISDESAAAHEANIAALEALGASVENPVPEPPVG